MNILNQFTHKFTMRFKSKEKATTPEFDASSQDMTNDDMVATVVKETKEEIATAAKPLEVIEPVEAMQKGRTYNTMIDKTIDLQVYMRRAKKSNYKATKNAGTEIKANNLDVYKDHFVVYKNALNEKYEKLVVDAKAHFNPEDYIYQKYFNTNSTYYESDLNEVERRIAYRYEIQMYTTGKISQVKFQDSLFREIPINQSEIEDAKNQFNMKMVNAQIRNILKESEINLDSKTSCMLSVDPYSYYISVIVDSEELKNQMEKALNVGENGQNLCRHIKNNALCENDTQITENGYLKYQAYHQVLKYTGLKLNELVEKKGIYYTEDGEDVFYVICRSINDSNEIPNKFKKQLKTWINNLLSELAEIGWHNIPDIVLRMEYNN